MAIHQGRSAKGTLIGGLGFEYSKAANYHRAAFIQSITTFERSSYPQGYGIKSIHLPLLAGGMTAKAKGSGNLTSNLTGRGVMTVSIHGIATVSASIMIGRYISAVINGVGNLVSSITGIGKMNCTIKIGATPSAFDIAQAVWLQLAASINVAGSFGKILKDLTLGGGGGGATPEQIWTYGARTLTSAGSGGATLAEIEASTILAKQATVNLVKAKTDNIPASPATEANVTGARTDISNLPANIRTNLATELARIDANITSRNAVTPDNVGIAAIKAKTDILENLTTGQIRTELAPELARIDVNIASRNSVAPDNVGIANIKAKTDLIPAVPATEGNVTGARSQITALNNVSTSQIRTELAPELARIDVNIGSRNSIAPDNSGIAAIKAKTDLIPAVPATEANVTGARSDIAGLNNLSASQVRTELAVELARIDAAITSRNSVAPDNAGISAIKAQTDKMKFTGDNIQSIAQVVADKTNYTLSTSDKVDLAIIIEDALINDSDGRALIQAIVNAMSGSGLNETVLAAAIRADIERANGLLDQVKAETGLIGGLF